MTSPTTPASPTSADTIERVEFLKRNIGDWTEADAAEVCDIALGAPRPPSPPADDTAAQIARDFIEHGKTWITDEKALQLAKAYLAGSHLAAGKLTRGALGSLLNQAEHKLLIDVTDRPYDKSRPLREYYLDVVMAAVSSPPAVVGKPTREQIARVHYYQKCGGDVADGDFEAGIFEPDAERGYEFADALLSAPIWPTAEPPATVDDEVAAMAAFVAEQYTANDPAEDDWRCTSYRRDYRLWLICNRLLIKLRQRAGSGVTREDDPVFRDKLMYAVHEFNITAVMVPKQTPAYSPLVPTTVSRMGLSVDESYRLVDALLSVITEKG